MEKKLKILLTLIALVALSTLSMTAQVPDNYSQVCCGTFCGDWDWCSG